MRVLLTGGTGSIGAAVLSELIDAGHDILALARSPDSATRLAAQGAAALSGDMLRPAGWAGAVGEVEAVIHLATSFSEEMGQEDQAVLQALIEAAQGLSKPRRFLYTGGTWLYGETGDRIATEATPYDPPAPEAWWPEAAELLLAAGCFRTSIIHPGMVYHRDGGVFSRFVADARKGGPIEIWGSPETRWPLVHRRDVASAYRLVLEKGVTGQSYNVASEVGVPVDRIVAAIAQRFGVSGPPKIRTTADVVAQWGSWAVGPTLDQRMGSAKITAELGWRPVVTDAIQDMLGQTAD